MEACKERQSKTKVGDVEKSASHISEGSSKDEQAVNHYRILWRSKTDKRRGFDIVDASDEKAAVADWSSRNAQDKEIDRVQEVYENGDLKQ